jgi:hypothetical protein
LIYYTKPGKNRTAYTILVGKLERTEDVEYIDESGKKYRNGPLRFESVA